MSELTEQEAKSLLKGNRAILQGLDKIKDDPLCQDPEFKTAVEQLRAEIAIIDVPLTKELNGEDCDEEWDKARMKLVALHRPEPPK